MGVRCFLIEPVFSGARFVGADPWDDRIIKGWIRKDTGEERRHNHEFGPGAMWYATWYRRNMEWANEQSPHLIVRCPTDHDWDIDSRASNCTLPEDRLHRCWVRHGEPPDITVDKQGLTCSAGAGSIALPNWHGFLRNGELVS